jgi:hypothetical protein
LEADRSVHPEAGARYVHVQAHLFVRRVRPQDFGNRIGVRLLLGNEGLCIGERLAHLANLYMGPGPQRAARGPQYGARRGVVGFPGGHKDDEAERARHP